jgi:hypothetical protein
VLVLGLLLGAEPLVVQVLAASGAVGADGLEGQIHTSQWSGRGSWRVAPGR